MRIVLTGHKGRLGQEIIKQAKDIEILGIDLPEVDITDVSSLRDFFYNVDQCESKIDLIVHAAAYTKVDGAEEEKELCHKVNVAGTRNVVDAAFPSIPVLYISTDYVFDGGRGNYKEDDIPNPVNYYALTKLLGEVMVSRYKHFNIIARTSFKPDKWQYSRAFNDAYTSADYISVIAKELLFLINNYKQLLDDSGYFFDEESCVFHIGTERKTILELARRKNPDIVAISRKEMSFKVPSDVSLNTIKWEKFKYDVLHNIRHDKGSSEEG